MVQTENIPVAFSCGKYTVMQSEIVQFYMETGGGGKIVLSAGIVDEFAKLLVEQGTCSKTKNLNSIEKIWCEDCSCSGGEEVELVIGEDFWPHVYGGLSVS